MMGSRICFVLTAVALTGCSMVEQEQRPAPTAPTGAQTVREQQTTVAQAPASAPDLWPSEAPGIHAKSAILIDADTGRTLYQKNADAPRQVASTQKLLTALLVVERGNLDQMVQIEAVDTNVEPTRTGMHAGQAYPRRQLLNAMLVHSCNDAAAALARDSAGSIEAFAGVMNERAAELGATSTHFVNPNGLPAPQHSTARDMARIACAAYRHPEVREIVRQPFYPFQFNNGRVSYMDSTDKLLGRCPGVDGMKTGYTDAAGRCLITSATLNGHHFILVQLGSQTRYIFDDAATMVQWAAAREGSSFFAFNPST
jgi:D-alanyl-D-alanine carboxypeptidase (penicillin-binding protein 5/6)